MLRTVIVAGSIFCIASTVVAAPLAPRKPSEVGELSPSSAPCPLNLSAPNALAIDTMNLPDGSKAPFVIPPDQVFVVTSVELTVQLVPAGSRCDFSLFRVSNGNFGGLITSSTITSTGGGVSTHVVIPNGSIVKSGTPLCITAINLDGGAQDQPVPFGTIHGFFAKDQ